MTERMWLKKLRDSNHLTQAQMAKRLSVAKTTYASYEQVYRTPRVEDAKRMAEKLDVDWTIFFEQNVLNTSINNSTAEEVSV